MKSIYLLALVIVGVSGLFEKEAGHYDWKMPLIGKPSGILAGPSSVIIASVSGVIASVDVETGAILWKVTPYSSNNHISKMSIDNMSILVSFSDAASLNLNLITGAISSSEIEASGYLLLLPLSIGESTIYVLSDDRVVCDRGGNRLWTREEALSSVDTVLFSPSSSSTAMSGTLIVHSSSANRVLAVSMNQTILWAISVRPESVLTPEFHLLLDDACYSIIDISNGELLPCERRKQETPFEYSVDTESGEIKGTHWRVNLHGSILRLISPSHTEFGSVPVLVKNSDASVVWKHMNPNMIVAVQLDEMGVTLTGIDTVTGSLPFQVLLPNAVTPVHGVLCDNWLVVHYKTLTGGFELATIDLFENRVDDFSIWNFVVGSFSFQRDTGKTPIVSMQQYVWGGLPVTAMAVTATLKGVTPRQVLFGTNRGILAVRKDVWLNSLRPLKEDPELMLPKYSPVFNMNPTDVVSYTHVLERINRIESFPTHLESTSIVCSFGLDIFCSPVYIGNAPYDVLSPFFNFKLLYLSVGLVTVLTIVTSVLAKRKALHDKWK